MEKLTKDIFLERAKKVHGDKYDYSKVEYVNATTLVKIICPIHGEFAQRPVSHVNNKQNCPLCSHQSYPNTNETFIKRATCLYGDRYLYDKVIYKNNKTKVIITCKKHGDFVTRPDNFLHNHGCPKCAMENKPQCKPWTTENFIKEAKKIYGEKYTYEKTNYKNYETPVIVTCKKHGDFETTPDNFLHNHSCPYCNNSLLENKIKNLLNENKIKYEEQKTFKWLKLVKNLKLDFYLPEYKIGIECQGLQHFKPSEWFGGEETFVETKKRDKIKKALCEENGIKMLYFSDLKEKLPDYVIKDKEVLLNLIYGK